MSCVGNLKTRMKIYERAQWVLGAGMLLMAVCFYLLEYRPQDEQLRALHQRMM